MRVSVCQAVRPERNALHWRSPHECARPNRVPCPSSEHRDEQHGGQHRPRPRLAARAGPFNSHAPPAIANSTSKGTKKVLSLSNDTL